MPTLSINSLCGAGRRARALGPIKGLAERWFACSPRDEGKSPAQIELIYHQKSPNGLKTCLRGLCQELCDLSLPARLHGPVRSGSAGCRARSMPEKAGGATGALIQPARLSSAALPGPPLSRSTVVACSRTSRDGQVQSGAGQRRQVGQGAAQPSGATERGPGWLGGRGTARCADGLVRAYVRFRASVRALCGPGIGAGRGLLARAREVADARYPHSGPETRQGPLQLLVCLEHVHVAPRRACGILTGACCARHPAQPLGLERQAQSPIDSPPSSPAGSRL